ncbi:hypothetical protein FZEAL_750 [Fusarium zealandicum]|uniref:DUF2264 domain-containing protein n=1 Tax=Fusarium zealandicum TaxID=1053134 RepID=A0A8H4UUR9_9HYPO|nr:hypothetical protein FZEAL_750 [Fusarium zealandicum]
MAGLACFTDNPFRERSDLVRATTALIEPLERYKSPAGARVKLYPSTAAAFDDVAAQLEGFARPLWVISAMVDGDASRGVSGVHPWIQGLRAGVDPDHSEYWGSLGSFDQRMVEMESIAFALLSAPEAILSSLDTDSKLNLTRWLQQINYFKMPQSNWRWFRVLVNLALFKVLGQSKSEARQIMDADFAILDEFYRGEGWSSDGRWGDERKQADYYSGSFAIQFAQLLYIRFAEGDEERVARYRHQATEFASRYWRYFDINGAAIPYGRSMIYRFACGAFWAAFALADIHPPAPFLSLGAIKGMLLRHLRWWSKQPEIFNPDGTMNIGYTYPNMYMSEDYNSRQSVYWCLKSFIVLGLPNGHPFWACDEELHPMERSYLTTQPHTECLSPVQVIRPAQQIVSSSPEHHFLLSSGQMTTKKFKAREAKYGKFAYSSAFGFSVPTGPELHQLAPDSTLTLSLDDGETWKVRCQPFNVRIETAVISTGGVCHEVPRMSSVWKPFKHVNFEIETTLIPLAPYFPGWHIRLHELRDLGSLRNFPGFQGLELVDASFAMASYSEAGYHIPREMEAKSESFSDGCHTMPSGILMKSRAGASGIVHLTPDMAFEGEPFNVNEEAIESEGFIIEADPNTNLITQRSFIPSMRYRVGYKTSSGLGQTEEETNKPVVFASSVFGVSGQTVSPGEMAEMWNKRPSLQIQDRAGQKLVIKAL